MHNKLAFIFILSSLSLSSCFSDNQNSQYEEDSSLIDDQSTNNNSDIEEIDTNGFDPNFDYVGSNATDFRIMASTYNANPEFFPEPYCMENDHYIKTVLNFGIITFSFKGTSIVAYHSGDKITEVHKFQCGKMTISKAKALEFIGEKQEKYSEGYVYFRGGGKKSLTKRYEKALSPSLQPPILNDSYDNLTEFRRIVDFFKNYGIPTSMLVYFDGAVDEYINDMEGLGYHALAVDYASAIPIFSDDLSEIVGSMTISYNNGSLGYALSYLKEDDFGTVITALEMTTLLGKQDVEIIQNPKFYIPDTSILPIGDWKIILGDGTRYKNN